MVDRTSQALQINAGAGVQAQQSNTGYVGPDVNKFATNHEVDAPDIGQSSGDRILGKLFDTGDKLAQQHFKIGTEEAYLSGVAKAGTIESEAQLDADPIMRDWQTAGYRDTMGRVAAADNEAKIAVDMKQLREVSPEKFNEYLAQRRAEVTQSWAGMSLTTRQTMFAQQLLSERAAIKKHAVEHYKFGVETEVKSIKVGYDAASATMNAAKGDIEPYTAATDAAFGNIYQSIVTNPKLPNEMRGKLLGEVAQDALANDNQLLYRQIMSKQVSHVDGSKGPMSDLISREDTIALVAANRASQDRTEGITALKFQSDLAFSRADWDNPNTPLQPFEAVQKMVEDGHAKGYFGRGLESANKAGSVLQDYYRAAVKKQKTAGLANAFITGNVEAVNRANASRQDSLDAWDLTVGSKMPLPDRVGALMTQGLAQQWPEAFKAAGVAMQPAWAQAMTNDAINPSNALMLHGVLMNISKAEADGKQGVMQAYIGAYNDPSTQDFILRVRSNAENGDDPTVAIMKARSSMLEETKAGNSGIYTALRAQANKDNAAALSTITPKGVFGSLWGNVKSIFSSSASNANDLRVKADYWENPSRVAENEGMVKAAVAQEMTDLTRDRPTMDAKGRTDLAMAKVVQRSVLTPWGPLIGPKGRNLETIYGVKDPERVSAALQEIVKPAPDNRVSFQFDVNGRLLVSERNTKDGMARSYSIDPMQIKQVAADQRKKEESQYSKVSGQGSKVGDVQFNGVNAVGVDNAQMYDFRARLLKHEGYSDVAKPDIGGSINKRTGKPVMTVGPGLSDTSDFYPKVDANGRITPQQAGVALRDASEAAAKAAINWQTGTRTVGKPAAFQLFAELAYQGGNYNKAMNPLIVAIRDRDPVKARAALEATPAWKMAGNSDRRKFYDNALNSIMKE